MVIRWSALRSRSSTAWRYSNAPASTVSLLSWPRYIEGMQHFKAETFPLVQQAGLR